MISVAVPGWHRLCEWCLTRGLAGSWCNEGDGYTGRSNTRTETERWCPLQPHLMAEQTMQADSISLGGGVGGGGYSQVGVGAPTVGKAVLS